MHELTREELEALLSYVRDLNNDISTNIERPVRDVFGTRPEALTDLFTKFKEALKDLQPERNDFIEAFPEHIPILVAAGEYYDQTGANRLRERLDKAIDEDSIGRINAQLQTLQSLRRKPWYDSGAALEIPELSDFLEPESKYSVRKRKVLGYMSNFFYNPWTIGVGGGVIVALLFPKIKGCF